KPHNEKAAGQRKRHIVIFNHGEQDEIEIQVSFNLSGAIKSLSNEYLTVPASSREKLNVEVKTTNINAKIAPSKKEATFVRFVYKHEKKAALGAEFNISIVPFETIFLDAYKSKYNINPFKGIELQFEEDELIFGDKISQKKMEITEDNQEVYVTQDEQLIITPLPEAFNDEDEVKIKIKYEQVSIPFILK